MTGQLADLPSFRRIAGIPFDACMAALESWQLTGHDGELRLGNSLLRGPIERDQHFGTCRIEVRLARGPLRPPARMRLDIEPWSPTATALELIPCQRVRPSAAAAGVLDLILWPEMGTIIQRAGTRQAAMPGNAAAEPAAAAQAARAQEDAAARSVHLPIPASR